MSGKRNPEWLKLQAIRQAFADYVRSEGCSCCRNTEAHEKAAALLAKLLHVPKFKDGSGYDFTKFASEL